MSRGVADGSVAAAVDPVSVDLLRARVWHATREWAAAANAHVRLAGTIGPLDPASEVAFATAVAKSLNLGQAQHSQFWATYMEMTVLLTAESGDLNLMPLRANSLGVRQATAGVFNGIAGPHVSNVHERDVRDGLTVELPDRARCTAAGLPNVGGACGMMVLRVFATDFYEASILKMTLDDNDAAASLAAKLRGTGLVYNVALESTKVVRRSDAQPVLPSDVKIWQSNENVGCSAGTNCLDVSFFIVATTEEDAEERAAGLVDVVSGEQCAREAGRPWKCVAEQLDAAAGWTVTPSLVEEPFVTVRNTSGGDSGTSTEIVAAVAAVASLVVCVCLGFVASKMYFRYKRQQGYKWVQFTDVNHIEVAAKPGATDPEQRLPGVTSPRF